jgi:GTP cyclohydrolase I
MTCRGVKKQDSKTVTSCYLGNFDAEKRAEVMALIR